MYTFIPHRLIYFKCLFILILMIISCNDAHGLGLIHARYCIHYFRFVFGLLLFIFHVLYMHVMPY